MFEACKREASSLGTRITGSELIGLVPQEAILKAGQFYSTNTHDKQTLINLAVDHLLLNNIRPFIIREKILENALTAESQTFT
ncbi:MAG: hypothetical protein IJ266_04240 [Elusimicrobiaceae bacterium]|nr:hypothetical protein [Elusimicrobiaceae bacterium]